MGIGIDIGNHALDAHKTTTVASIAHPPSHPLPPQTLSRGRKKEKKRHDSLMRACVRAYVGRTTRTEPNQTVLKERKNEKATLNHQIAHAIDPHCLVNKRCEKKIDFIAPNQSINHNLAVGKFTLRHFPTLNHRFRWEEQRTRTKAKKKPLPYRATRHALNQHVGR